MISQQLQTNETQEQFLLRQGMTYSQLLKETFQQIFNIELVVEAPVLQPEGIRSGKDISVSVLFTGTVYGEYVLTVNEATAYQLIGKSAQDIQTQSPATLRDEVGDALCELLNLVVGQAVVGISQKHNKLTITSPKISFGHVRHPRYRAVKAVLQSSFGEVESYLYIDYMKLDISTSYSEALTSLQVANAELREAFQKLQIQQERLIYSEKMSALGTMAAGVAHEINTPLATISMAEGNMKSMLEDLNFDRASFEKSLNVIEKTVQRIVKVTTALRAYAKDGAGGAYEPVSLGRVVDESLIFCESAMKDAGIQISIVHHSGAEIDFDCRVQQVTQVLLNLLQNAMDAVETASSKEIKIETKSDEDIIEIKVSDSGAGMADEIKNKIFDPFFTTKQVGKGMGLGLSLAKGIIDLHQGTIRYERIAERSNFIVRVPKQRPK